LTSGGLGGPADPPGTVVVTKTGDPLNDPHHASSENVEIYLPGDPEPIYAHQYRSNTPADDVICLLPNVKCPAP
jgi:hypothetical protein